MIIRLFRENQIFSIFINSLLLVLYWIATGFHKVFDPGINSVYYSSLFHVFPALKQIDNFQALASAINVVLLLIVSLFLSRIIVKYQVIPHRTSLPAFFFIIVTAPYFHNYSGFSFPLVTVLVLLVIIDLLFESIDSKTTSRRFFESALLLSLVSFLNVYILFYSVFMLFIWIQFRGLLRWREFFYIVFGIALPYIFLISILYLTDYNVKEYWASFSIFQEVRSVLPFFNLIYILGIFTLLLILIASVKILRMYVKMKIIIRKYSLTFFALFIASILIAAFFTGIDTDIIFYLALPVSFLFGFYFSTCRINIFNQVLFLILIALNITVVLF